MNGAGANPVSAFTDMFDKIHDDMAADFMRAYGIQKDMRNEEFRGRQERRADQQLNLQNFLGMLEGREKLNKMEWNRGFRNALRGAGNRPRQGKPIQTGTLVTPPKTGRGLGAAALRRH